MERREKRLLDAYEADEIELEELKRRREELRKLAAAAERVSADRDRKDEFDLEYFVKLVVRGARRLQRFADLKQRKEIIHALFESVIVKGDGVVGFKPHATLISGESSAECTIDLSEPFRLTSPENDLPPRKKKCICCEHARDSEEFRPGINRCRPCVAAQMHGAYLRRRNESGRQATHLP